jgi:hypothetical protein
MRFQVLGSLSCAVALSAEAALVAQYAEGANQGKTTHFSGVWQRVLNRLLSRSAGRRAGAAFIFVFQAAYTFFIDSAVFVS